MKRTACFLALLSAALFFLACSHRSHSVQQQINIAIENDIQTLDPATLSDPYTSRIVWQMYEGLIGLDENGRALPLLAESWDPSADYRIWTFHLRSGVYYHRSAVFLRSDSTRQVTAEDVKYSLTRFGRGFGSFVFSGLVEGFDAFLQKEVKAVSGFVVIDSLTFQFHLLQPDPYFIYRLTSPYLGVMPPEAVEDDPSAFGRTVCVGTGPFYLKDRTETRVSLAKNDRYWRRTEGNLDELHFIVEKNPQFRVTQLENETYQLLQLPTPFFDRYLDGDSLKPNFRNRLRLTGKTTNNVHYLGINCKKIGNSHLRRAIGFGIDKKAIVDILLRGQATVATSPVIAGLQGYFPPEGMDFNPDSARSELEQSGYRNEPIVLLVSDAPNSEQLGQIIQSDLLKIGITIKLQKFDWNTQISRIFSGERPDMFILFSEWIYGAPEFIIDSYNSQRVPNPNLFGYSNSEVDALLNRIPQMTDRYGINDLCYRAESMAIAECPAVWLFHQKNIYLMDKKLRNFRVNAHNYWDLADAVWQ